MSFVYLGIAFVYLGIALEVCVEDMRHEETCSLRIGRPSGNLSGSVG